MAPLKKKRIQIRKFPVTQYQADALKQLCPPENITVSEWAENYRVLDSKTSALPGPWRNEKTPYLKEIMDELINYDTERIIFVKPTQVGGTEALQNMLGYVIQQDPSPTMIVYPTDILAKSISENRLEPMIMATRTLKSLYNKNESSQLELQFDGMYLSLAGSNSPSSLASKAIKYLFLDEVDKYPGSSKKESDPISLAMERTKTFRNRKIYMTSTPTLATGHIWKALMDADIEKHYFIPCPHCGSMIELTFQNLKFPSGDDLSNQDRADMAVYRCQECGGDITDQDKEQMLRYGEWKVLIETLWNVKQFENRSSVIGDTVSAFTGQKQSGNGNSNESASQQFVFSPTYRFEAGTPSKEDMVEANRMSQAEFKKMMKEYLRTEGRRAFA